VTVTVADPPRSSIVGVTKKPLLDACAQVDELGEGLAVWALAAGVAAVAAATAVATISDRATKRCSSFTAVSNFRRMIAVTGKDAAGAVRSRHALRVTAFARHR
jgi:hypothetical protein